MHSLKPKQTKYDQIVEVKSEHVSAMSELTKLSSMPREKSIVQATVSSITKDYVWVNIGIKAEGKIDINEFKINGFGEVPNLGDLISVWIEKHEDSNGSLVVSFSKVNHIRSWKELEDIFQSKKLVEGTIIEKVRGGFIVALLPWGVKAFLPSSQIEFRSIGGKSSNILQTMRNKKLPFFIIRMERKWNIIVSRKSIEQNDAQSEDKPKSDKSESKQSDNETTK
ncbi:S1 RNA-binding domain-containing protein [Candidatus Cytomitobacter primus]|uniref:S1 motif domain-containing protein n=1 Tax=Candidatus Cytomitobacter primus TaxID=2066024 RepID=A0A5C0UFA5_9PROT|nr:S1 RNA-binding domain-containing protein [Candidatus Cytomitobacter primus]QEK38775.1 hypothetical protein FZC34_02580 [Candidatus Cytomitobacter primus]